MHGKEKYNLFLKNLPGYRYTCEYIHVHKSIYFYYNLGIIGSN